MAENDTKWHMYRRDNRGWGDGKSFILQAEHLICLRMIIKKLQLKYFDEYFCQPDNPNYEKNRKISEFLHQLGYE